jgi:hypothetical protein
MYMYYVSYTAIWCHAESIHMGRIKGGGTAPAACGAGASTAADATTADAPAEKTVALVATTIWRSSHAQHIVDRFGLGYPRDGVWHRPRFKLVSMYVDQQPEGDKPDLAPLRAAEFGATIYSSIAAALRRGGDKLSVDAVLIVGEHGTYPVTELGQIQYPRYEFLTAVADVFRTDGRACPVFSDKHLSWSWDNAVRMVGLSKELRFPLLAGSSVPCGYRMPDLELPLGTTVEEALCVTNLGGEGGWFHALETLQCMVERRAGGETGVHSVHATQGDAVWPLLEAGLEGGGGGGGRGSWEEGGIDPSLLEACLCRSQQLRNVQLIDGSTPTVGGKPDGNRIPGNTEDTLPMYSQHYPSVEDAMAVVDSPHLIRVQYRDGSRAAVLVLSGLVGDTTFAARVRTDAQTQTVSCLFNNVSRPSPTASAFLLSLPASLAPSDSCRQRTGCGAGGWMALYHAGHDCAVVLPKLWNDVSADGGC